MKNNNKQLLDQVINDLLQECVDNGITDAREAFDTAMKALKLSNEIDKTQTESQVAIGNLTIQEKRIDNDKEIGDENIQLQREKISNENSTKLKELDIVETKTKNEEIYNSETIKLQKDKLDIENNNKYDELEYMKWKTQLELDMKEKELNINEQIRKLDIDVQNRKISVDEYLKKMEILNQDKQQNRDKGLKLFEVLAAIMVVPLVDFAVKSAFAKTLCNFEKDYTFTTTAGKSLTSLFKFKK